MDISVELHEYFLVVTDAIIIAISLIATVLQVGWTTVVVSNLRKQYAINRRIKNEGNTGDKMECVTKITHGKFKLAILTLEYIGGISYLIGNFYPMLYRINPIFNKLALPFNTTCITLMETQTAWVKQLRFPVSGVSFAVARLAMIFVMGIGISFFRFISNSFVSGTYKYKKIYHPLKYSLMIAIFIFLLGLPPQLLLISRSLEVIIFPILYFHMIKHTVFLKLVVRWRRQDLYHNSEKYLLRLHDKQNKYFTITIKCFIIVLVFVFLAETLVTIEMFLSLILYYGKCFFPILYDIQYEGIISENQLHTFNTVLFVFSILERCFCVIALVIFLLPYLILSVLLCVRNLRIRKQTAYHYSIVLTDPLLKQRV